MRKAKTMKVKNPIAVALASLRMTKLSARRRKEIATTAVTARWAKHKKEGTDV